MHSLSAERLQKLRLALSAVFFLSVLLWIADFIFYVSADAPLDTPIDGPFQALTMPYRVGHGQWPGADFQSYLGTGLAAVVGGLASGLPLMPSVISFVGTALAVLIFTASLFPVLLYILRSWSNALVCTAVFLLVCVALFWPQLFEPGNSLRPLRTAVILPAGLALFRIFVAFQARRRWRDVVTMSVLVAATAGLAMIWSNDGGIATALCLPIAFGAGLARTDGLFKKTTIAAVVLTIVLIPLTTYAAAEIVTGGNAANWWRYTVAVAGDQFWYFTPFAYPRVWFWSDLPLTEFVFPSMLAALLVFLMYGSPPILTPVFVLLLAWTGAGGSSALLRIAGGFYDEGYFSAFAYCHVALGVLLLVHARTFDFARLVKRSFVSSFTVPGLLLAASLILQPWSLPGYRGFMDSTKLELYEQDRDRAELFAHLRALRDRKQRSIQLIADYAGPASYLFSEPNKAGIDLFIHALGEFREGFRDVLAAQNHDATITLRPKDFDWVSWSFVTNYWAYRELILRHRIAFSNDKYVVWTPGPDPGEVLQDPAPVECSIKPDERQPDLYGVSVDGFAPPTAATTYVVEVDLRYEVEVRQPGLPPFGHRFIAALDRSVPDGADRYVGLDPRRPAHRFPILSDGRTRREIRLQTLPPGRVTLTNLSCTARVVRKADDLLRIGYQPFRASPHP